MKKRLFLLLGTLCIVLCSCGQGVSQEEYDKVVAERNVLLEEQENLVWYSIGKEKLLESAEFAKANMEEDYNALLEYLHKNKDKYIEYESIIKEVSNMYTGYVESIEWEMNDGIKVNEELAMQMGDNRAEELMKGLLSSEERISLLETCFFVKIRESFLGFDAEYDEFRLIK